MRPYEEYRLEIALLGDEKYYLEHFVQSVSSEEVIKFLDQLSIEEFGNLVTLHQAWSRMGSKWERITAVKYLRREIVPLTGLPRRLLWDSICYVKMFERFCEELD